jgi:hypothetical protein
MTKKNNKKSKEKGPNWKHYYHWKNKNHKLDLNQIASHKNFDKIAKKTNLEIKSKKIKLKYLIYTN